MILNDFIAVMFNILFGMFFSIALNIADVFTSRKNNIIISNLIYFFVTILSGILYIIYIDKIFFVFKLYYLLFLTLGFFVVLKFNFLKIEKQLLFFSSIIKVVFKLLGKVLLFSINYALWASFFNFFNKRIKNKGRKSFKKRKTML